MTGTPVLRDGGPASLLCLVGQKVNKMPRRVNHWRTSGVSTYEDLRVTRVFPSPDCKTDRVGRS
jgi:hypothetical protein